MMDGRAREIFREYDEGVRYKASLGELGLVEQGKRNERFYLGDQWHGAQCGGERPLVRYNVIKRIGDYKTAMVSGAPMRVSYYAEGEPDGDGRGGTPSSGSGERNVAEALGDLSAYFDASAQRLGLDEMRERVLRDAFIRGTAFLYTYWDSDVPTGLYADAGRTVPVRGDIACETLDIEQVTMGDPGQEDIQKQPYLLISQRLPLARVRERAEEYGLPPARRDAIRPDAPSSPAGDGGTATVVTRLWKTGRGDGVRVMAAQATREVMLREPWNLGIRRYPLSVFRWECGQGLAYGESEVTHLIPNQIAINRLLTANVWAGMMTGAPITVVNGDVVQGPVTNDPGQVLKVFGSAEEVGGAVRYVSPPDTSSGLLRTVASLIGDTLSNAGANEAALGDVKAENAAAILALQEAASLPLQSVQRRFTRFMRDVALTWAEFWVMTYGARPLRVGGRYRPFDGRLYRDLVLRARVEVTGSPLWARSQMQAALDKLLDGGWIGGADYIAHLPGCALPGQRELLRTLREKEGKEVRA